MGQYTQAIGILNTAVRDYESIAAWRAANADRATDEKYAIIWRARATDADGRASALRAAIDVLEREQSKPATGQEEESDGQ